MFRRWLSSFWRDNKEKITKLAKVFGLLILISIVAAIVFSSLSPNENNQNNNEIKIYNPDKTIISGGNISEKQYEEENNIIKTFVDYCNEQNTKEAYNLLSQECKDRLYPTLQDFENKYYKIIFQAKRQYNIQSWVNENRYSTYKVRFTDDFMSTGNYDDTEKYEDYITIVTDEKNYDNKKININSYVKTENLTKETKTDKLETKAISVDTYMEYVICTVRFKNTTDKDILLDTLNNSETIKLIGSNGTSYKLDTMNLRVIDLRIEANKEKDITLKFKKQHGSDVGCNSIDFKRVITDYTEYNRDSQNYERFEDVSISL